jgi:S-methylmethionine-dependent homocysteine/selenocysteine methylase
MFASFTLMESDKGRSALLAYFDRYVPLAVERNIGFILETPTWRANPDWGAKLGYDATRLSEINRASIELMNEVRAKYETPHTPLVISGCIGPRGDGYDPATLMSPGAAEDYHAWQVRVFREAGADLITAMTMTNIPEAIGVARAAEAAGIQSVISFTVETDGRLPTGDELGGAIEAVDADTNGSPAYYMINCAHPTHFADALNTSSAWVNRVRGLRANASRQSHAELDNAADLDSGNPTELGANYADLLRRLPHINVLGGCCGTDHRHIDSIAQACCPIA